MKEIALAIFWVGWTFCSIYDAAHSESDSSKRAVVVAWFIGMSLGSILLSIM